METFFFFCTSQTNVLLKDVKDKQSSLKTPLFSQMFEAVYNHRSLHAHKIWKEQNKGRLAVHHVTCVAALLKALNRLLPSVAFVILHGARIHHVFVLACGWKNLPSCYLMNLPTISQTSWAGSGGGPGAGGGRVGGGGELWHLIECYKVPPFLTDYVKSLWKAFSCVPNAWEVDEASTATVFVFHQIALWVWRLEQLAERQWRAFEAVLNLTWQQSVTHCWLNTLTTTATSRGCWFVHPGKTLKFVAVITPALHEDGPGSEPHRIHILNGASCVQQQ